MDTINVVRNDHSTGLKGTVLLMVYINKPVEAIFEGELYGRDIDMVMARLKRLYAEWKHKQIKGGESGKQEEEKKQEEVVEKKKRGRPRKINKEI